MRKGIAKPSRSKNRVQIPGTLRESTTKVRFERNRGIVDEYFVSKSILGTVGYALVESFKSSTIFGLAGQLVCPSLDVT